MTRGDPGNWRGGDEAGGDGRDSQAADVSAYYLNSGKSQSGLTSAATLDRTKAKGSGFLAAKMHTNAIFNYG